MTKTFIIAEAGSNHNRDFNMAMSLIDVAKNSGASAVKFQTYSSETLYSKNTPDFAGHTNISKLIKSIELPREWQSDLKKYCDENDIEFMSTPFDEKAVD
jgi:N,N'-diacetyllegionaminate synthase